MVYTWNIGREGLGRRRRRCVTVPQSDDGRTRSVSSLCIRVGYRLFLSHTVGWVATSKQVH